MTPVTTVRTVSQQALAWDGSKLNSRKRRRKALLMTPAWGLSLALTSREKGAMAALVTLPLVSA